MRSLIRKWIPILVASSSGLVTLAGYLFPDTIVSTWRDALVEWAVIVAAFALILGVFNILRVHGQRIVGSGGEWVFSLVLVVAALVSWIPPLLYGPSGGITQAMLRYILFPLGGSIAALLVFTLTWSAVRLLRYRQSLPALLFILIVSLSLLGTTPLLGVEFLSEVRDWLVRVPGMAGFRGLLLGVGLGTVITGLRVLLGRDHPYSEA